jgi:hypothetical protein
MKTKSRGWFFEQLRSSETFIDQKFAEEQKPKRDDMFGPC